MQTATHLVSMEEMASHPNVDIVVIATSGKAGLKLRSGSYQSR